MTFLNGGENTLNSKQFLKNDHFKHGDGKYLIKHMKYLFLGSRVSRISERRETLRLTKPLADPLNVLGEVGFGRQLL